MKNASPRTATRRSPSEGPSAAAAAAGAIELREDRLVIRLPDFRLLQLVARSVLLTAAILTFPWLRAVILSAGAPPAPPPPGSAAARSRWVDDPFHLPMLLRDLRRQGLLAAGARAVFLGDDPGSRLPSLRQNQIEPVSSDREWIIPDRSVDFALAAGDFRDASFEFIDRVLRVGGITAVRLSSDPSRPFRLPPNYRMVYIRRFGSTIVAIKKISHAGAGADAATNAANPEAGGAGTRRLLGIPTAKEAALSELDYALLEPPFEHESVKPRGRTGYLPDPMGAPLAAYPRRVLLDAGRPGRAGSEESFQERYPKGDSDFEIIRLDVVAGRAWEEAVEEMKADAEVVEEMANGSAAGLVDEPFLDRENRWRRDGKRSGMPYWECLAPRGRQRDEGMVRPVGSGAAIRAPPKFQMLLMVSLGKCWREENL